MYKIICDNRVIDVVQRPNFFRILPNNTVAYTDKTSAHGIVGSDGRTLYGFAPVAQRLLTIVTIEDISIDEFNRLSSLLNSNQEVCADESALAKAKRDKIKRLSNMCKNKITAGFTIELSDGKEYGFKLTTEDQLNLMAIENQLNSGTESFIYHATNQPCRWFEKDDMVKIINAFKRFTLYHTTYFNTAKQYINSLTSLEKVNMFTYGTDVSEAATDIALKQLLKNGGNV